MRISEILDLSSVKTTKAMINKMNHYLEVLDLFKRFNQFPDDSILCEIRELVIHVEKSLLFKIISDTSHESKVRSKLNELRDKMARR